MGETHHLKRRHAVKRVSRVRGQRPVKAASSVRNLSKSAVDPRSPRRKHREHSGFCPGGGPSSPGRRTANPCLRCAKTVVIVSPCQLACLSVEFGRTLGPPHQPSGVGQAQTPIPIPARPVRNPAAKRRGDTVRNLTNRIRGGPGAQPLLSGTSLSGSREQLRAAAQELSQHGAARKLKIRHVPLCGLGILEASTGNANCEARARIKLLRNTRHAKWLDMESAPLGHTKLRR